MKRLLRSLGVLAPLAALGACAAVRAPVRLSDAAAPPGLNSEYGVYSFVLNALIDDEAPRRLLDTILVVNETGSAWGGLVALRAPDGFEEALASLRSANQRPVYLGGELQAKLPVMLVGLATLGRRAHDRPMYQLSRPGFNADSTRAAVFALPINDVCPAGQLYFLARRPGRAWVLGSTHVSTC